MSTKNKNITGKKAKTSRCGGKIKPKTMAVGLLSVFALLLVVLYMMPRSNAQSKSSIVEDSAVAANASDAQSDTFFASNSNKKKKKQQSNAQQQPQPKKQRVVTDIFTINYEQEAQPQLTVPATSQLIHHKAYSTSYNAEYKIPNWTFYELTLAETMGRLRRSNNFQPDPNVPDRQSAQLTDYRGSGFDRGHMAPSMDFNWDVDIEDETYYLSNMCPQDHDFNSGIWLDLEHQVRRWAERDSAICVACGPVLPKKDQSGQYINPVTGKTYHITTIGRNKVLVPEHFFKVVLSPFGDHPKAIGFIMPNENVLRRDGRGNAPVKDFAVSIDRVEELTGIDFFAILPDDIEDRIEKRYEYDDWFKKARKY